MNIDWSDTKNLTKYLQDIYSCGKTPATSLSPYPYLSSTLYSFTNLEHTMSCKVLTSAFVKFLSIDW